ncbi:MAG: ATP-binding protein [Mariniphaga sp.]|nr:ATP-binding protein [Mariniphaga sp.]
MKTISDHMLDIVQNSIRAHATWIEVIFSENKNCDIYQIKIIDNGCGMSKELLNQAANPFFTSRSTRKVGLGLSLLKQNAEASQGSVKIISEPGKGTVVQAIFQHSHLDRPPLGDIWNVIYLLLVGNPTIRFSFRYQTEKGTFELDSTELLKLMDGIPIVQQEVKNALIEYLKNNLKEIEAGI